MTAPITITVDGADDFAADIIAHAVGDLLREHGVSQPRGVNCGANPLDFDLSGYAVNVVRVAPAPPAPTFEVKGPPVSKMSAEIRSRIIAMGIEPRRVRAVHVHPSSGLLKVRHRPLYMREAVLSEETAEGYATWQARNHKATTFGRVTIGDTGHVIDMPDPKSHASLKAFWEAVAAHYRSERVSDTTGITVTISGPAGEQKTRFGEHLLRALSDYGSTLGKTQDVVEQNIRRFHESEEAGRPVYVGQFEGSPLLLGTRTVEPDAIA